PHLAGVLNDIEVDIEKVKVDLINFKKENDYVVIEGAGGLYCPAVKGKLFADIITELNQEIIIVTTPDLGRINHTLMTIDCAKKRGIKIKGVIINKMPNEKTLSQENFVNELKMFSDVEILGIIPEMKNPTKNEIIKQFSSIIKL
ncbi:MAG: dethiobiotin synthase, partial [Candidatus Gastranaerophilales bacterium]|nr:dethiobiotin synthase [Candidatus Gastranaerophilales bacterium]